VNLLACGVYFEIPVSLLCCVCLLVCLLPSLIIIMHVDLVLSNKLVENFHLPSKIMNTGKPK
jgi:hypothetical protein